MKDVTVKKAELREKIQTNRDAHKAIFDEAVEGYREKIIGLLEEHLKRVKKGKMETIRIWLPVPEDHTGDYDRVLAMLDMSVDEEITIDQNTFSSYVMDEWHWKGEFLSTNSAYSATAASLL